MARNRIIYQSEALCVSRGILSAVSSEHAHLEKIQSADYGFSVQKVNVAEFGEEEYLDSYTIDTPTVNLDFSYYLSDGFNERALGFYVQTGESVIGSFPSGHMIASLGQNFYLLNSEEGDDLNDGNGATTFIGFGNGFVSSYSLEASIGSAPTVSVSIEASNIISATCSSVANGYEIKLPSINPTDGSSYSSINSVVPTSTRVKSNITALRPGDISISFGNFATQTPNQTFKIDNQDGIYVQSVGIFVPLTREPIQRVGSKFPYARAVEFPIQITLYVKAIVNEVGAGNLAEILKDGYNGDILLTMKNKEGGLAASFLFKKAVFDQESFETEIGQNEEIEMIFETQISGPNDTSHGIFMSAAGNREVFAESGDTWDTAFMTWEEAFIKWGGG